MFPQNIAAESLEGLLSILQAGGIGTWTYDLTGNTILWHGKTHDLLGLRSGVAPSVEAVLAALEPHDRERLLAEARQAIRHGGRIHLEGRVRWPDDTLHWLLVQGQVFSDEQGEPVKAAGIVMCITERKRLDQERELFHHEVARQRELLERLFQNAPTGLAVIDARSRCYVLANAKYEANTGPVQAPGCFIGRQVGDFSPPELKKFMHGILEHVIKTKQPFTVRQFETSFGPGREHTWWDNDVVPLIDEHGEVEAVLAITNEVTDEVLARKRIEELALQMQSGRDELETIINSMSEALVVFTPEGKVIRTNPAVLRLHGVQDFHEVPLTFDEHHEVWEMAYPDGRLVPPEDWPLMRAIRGEFVSDMELHGRRRHTAHTWAASYSVTPVLDAQGQVRLLVMAVHDLTAIKRAQQQLRELMTELERSNKDLEQFAYIASHDLQEPLRMISGFMGLLRDRYSQKLDDKALEYIARAINGAHRMHGLIQDLLSYSRISTRGSEPVRTSMQRVYDRAIEDLVVRIDETGAQVTHDELPDVLGDETQLSQVLQNLIANAIKFRRPDVAPRIHLGARREGSLWVFSVSDNGIGIEPEHFGRVFMLFQRLHTRRSYEGTGIGLALVKKIIERHGGDVCVESEFGRGSTFYFTLPAA